MEYVSKLFDWYDEIPFLYRYRAEDIKIVTNDCNIMSASGACRAKVFGIFQRRTVFGLLTGCIVQSPKEMALWRHIAGVDYYKDTYVTPDGEDWCVLSNNGPRFYDGFGNRAVAINTTTEDVSLINGVVLRSDHIKETPHVLSLYNLLGEYCRLFKRCLLTYDKIRIYSEMRKESFVIRFKIGKETERFFTKMYMDVV